MLKEKEKFDKERYKEDVLLKNEDGTTMTYKESIKQKYGKTQLKLTLTTEEDEALRAYCGEHGLKPQAFITGLIRQALELGED